jgi:peptidoglycan hydrolase CwlO-like protein|tara:strand:+ start:967 stop:1263 length:297 start_codon:yes stop_codon:yes gene_type:complete
MNIKINASVVSITTAIIIQFAGVVFFISGLSSDVANHSTQIGKIEANMVEIAAAIESLDKSITLMHDQQKNINSEHKMLFEKTNLYDGVYTPAESRKY